MRRLTFYFLSTVFVLGIPFRISAQATQLVFTTAVAASTIAGGTFNALTVQAQDGSGNLVPTFNGSITVAITSGSGTPGAILTGPSLTMPAVGGIASFTGLSIDRPGAYTLTASSSGLSGPSSAFVIYGNVVFTNPPATTTVSQNIDGATGIQVSIEGSGGAVVTGGSYGVCINFDAGGALFSGGTAVTLPLCQPTTSGVATFQGYSIQIPGNYALDASAQAVPSAQLVPTTPSKFTVTALPPAITLGQANPTKVQPVNFAVTFGEPGTWNSANNYGVTVVGGPGSAIPGPGGFSVAVTQTAAASYTVAVGNVACPGPLGITIAAGVEANTPSGLSNPSSGTPTSVNTAQYNLPGVPPNPAVGCITAASVAISSSATPQQVSIPIWESLNSGLSVDSIDFSFEIDPSSTSVPAAPPITTGTLSFTPGPSMSSSILVNTPTSNVISVTWITNASNTYSPTTNSYPISGNTLLGTVNVTIPGGVSGSYNFVIRGAGADSSSGNPPTLTPEPEQPGPNGTLSITVPTCFYTKGSLWPNNFQAGVAASFECGAFGKANGPVSIEDVIYMFKAYYYGGFLTGYALPPACSAAFGAMDLYPYTGVPPVYAGDGGPINNNDINVAIELQTNILSTLYKVADGSQDIYAGCTTPAGVAGNVTPQIDRPKGRSARQVDGVLELGPTKSVGHSVRVALYVRARHDLILSGFGVGMGWAGDVTAPLRLTSGGAPKPTLLDTETPGKLAAAWLKDFSYELTAGQRLFLGYLEWDKAAGASKGQLEIYEAELNGETLSHRLQIEMPGGALR